MTERHRKLCSDTERQNKRLFAKGLRDRALERALRSRGDKVKEEKLFEARRLALSKERQNESPIRRVMGKFYEAFVPPSTPSADYNTPAQSGLPAQGQSLFADIDTNSLPKLAEYKG